MDTGICYNCSGIFSIAKRPYLTNNMEIIKACQEMLQCELSRVQLAKKDIINISRRIVFAIS